MAAATSWRDDGSASTRPSASSGARRSVSGDGRDAVEHRPSASSTRQQPVGLTPSLKPVGRSRSRIACGRAAAREHAAERVAGICRDDRQPVRRPPGAGLERIPQRALRVQRAAPRAAWP